MKKRIYVLNQRQEETFDAAGKAMRDVFAVLAEYESKVIWSVPKRCSRFIKLLDLPYLALFLLFRVGKESIVFYAIPENHMKVRILKKLQKVRHYKLICFINDLNAFRYGAVELSRMDEQARRELEVVGMADTVLIPNRGTEELLKKLGMTARLVPVGIWDYLMTEEQSRALSERRPQWQETTEASAGWEAEEGEASAVQEEKAGEAERRMTRIAFAGNLNKSAFLPLMDIPDGITLELWGRLDDDKKAELYAAQGEKCRYHGVLSSDEIPQAVCTMDYGLVWDGEGRDEIAGGLGEYLRYNNSHKCALYLASGIPVIVWDKSGMSHFVREHGCGIAIGRLGELKEKLAAADYGKLRAQALATAEQLRQGYYLKQAIETALEDSCRVSNEAHVERRKK